MDRGWRGRAAPAVLAGGMALGRTDPRGELPAAPPLQSAARTGDVSIIFLMTKCYKYPVWVVKSWVFVVFFFAFFRIVNFFFSKEKMIH